MILHTTLSIGDGLLHNQVNIDVVALEPLKVGEQSRLHLLCIKQLEFPIPFQNVLLTNHVLCSQRRKLLGDLDDWSVVL
jgi:hypothetical protein